MNHIDPRLASAFAYDAVDIAANRAGQLSPEQEQKFRNAARRARRASPRIMLVLVLVAVLVAVISVMFAAFATSVPSNQLLIGGGATAVFVALIGLLSLLNFRQANKMDNVQVLVAEGRPIITPTGLESHSRMDVGGVGFHILWGDIDYFDDATIYRIYHTWIGAGVPVILSIEVLTSNDRELAHYDRRHDHPVVPQAGWEPADPHRRGTGGDHSSRA